MRTRYFTSHYKLSAIAVLLFVSLTIQAKKKQQESNIVCFAAKSKWVCAPEDQQEIASEKANKLLEKTNTELLPSEVVIKSINIPKFDTTTNQEYINTEPTKEPPKVSQIGSKNNDKKKETHPVITKKNSNPYALLWSHQLIGVSTPQSAINYVRKHQLNKDDILIIQSERKGMDWWIILFGLYQNKQTGLDNENSLPDNIGKPWLRPLKNLQVNGFIEKY